MPSELKVNKLSPYTGSTLTIGDSGDTISLPSGVSLDTLTITGDLTVDTDTLFVDSTNNRVGVGTTSPSVTFDAEADGATVAHFNRATSDGDIIELQKDGTAVGSIYNGGSNLGINSSGGLLLVDDIITPTSGADNTKDLGRSSARWKDAYIGGNIYLGGTTSANALDDYEEGTWTPVYTTNGTDFTSVTYDFRNAYYTKIGRQVTCTLSMRTDAITKGSASGTVVLGGLPFQVDKDAYVPVAIGTDFAVNNPSGLRILDNTTTAFLQRSYNNTSLVVSDMGTGANDNFIALVFTYFTD